MGLFNQEIANPTKGLKEKSWQKCWGGHLAITSMRTLTSPKWRRVTCPSKWTLKCGDLPSVVFSALNLQTKQVYGWVRKWKMVILGDKALDHLGSLQRFLVPYIQRSGITQGYKVSLNVLASSNAWFSMCR